MISGLINESRKLLDYDFTSILGDTVIPDYPLGRDSKAKTLPVLYQGSSPLCVPCSTLFISNWFDFNKSCFSPRDLAILAGINDQGTLTSKVLDIAYRHGLIPNYLYVRDPKNNSEILRALSISPLIIGLWDWPLIPHQGHAMVLLDRLADGSWLCVNWANEHRTDFVTLPTETQFEFAVSFKQLTKNQIKHPSFITSLIRKLKTFYATQSRQIPPSFLS